ncbi:MAG: PorV/PorQ family protein [bacterium]|nr:PorV/PorQ family protein [bacterium]
MRSVTWLPLLVSALLLLAGPARAGSVLELYGDENVGTAGAQFLRLPVGARAVGLGRAYVACAVDGPAAFWNPAGIMRTPGLGNLFFSHVAYAADIDLEYAAYTWRRQNFGFALTGSMLRSGEIPRTDELHQEGTGDTFNANQFVLSASVAKSMTDRFSLGGTAKLYQENLDEFEVRGLLMDLGVLYYTGLGDLRVGFAVRNFGPDLQPGGTPPPLGPGYATPLEFQSFQAPTSGSFGLAYTWRLGERTTLLTTSDFHHPTDASESFRAGAELGLAERLLLRGGFETNRLEGGLGAGFGVNLARDEWRIRLDYAISDMGAFGTIHYLSIDLSPLPDGRRRR